MFFQVIFADSACLTQPTIGDLCPSRLRFALRQPRLLVNVLYWLHIHIDALGFNLNYQFGNISYNASFLGISFVNGPQRPIASCE